MPPTAATAAAPSDIGASSGAAAARAASDLAGTYAQSTAMRSNPKDDPGAGLAPLLRGWVVAALFSREPQQQRLLQSVLISAAGYVLASAVIGLGAALGLATRERALWAAVLAVLPPLGFYTVMRCGWNRRWADPSLAMAQSLTGLLWVCACYLLAPGLHGALLLFVPLVLLGGAFGLNPRGLRIVLTSAALMMSATLILAQKLDPAAFPPQAQMVHLALLALALPVIALRASQWHAQQLQLRQREAALQEQTEALLLQQVRLNERQADLTTALNRIDQLSTRDELTGLHNRRHMRELLEQQIRLSRRTAQTFTMAIIDLDHFRRVNDSYGHEVGDEALRNFSAFMRGLMRDTDVMARWGGEQFLVLFPNTHAEQCLIGLQRARERLEEEPMSRTIGSLRLSFSAGVCEHQDDETLDQMAERADKGLYKAKGLGRNCSVVEA